MGMIGTMSDPVGLVSEHLRGRGITLPRDNEWLNACVECFISNNPNQTQNQLFAFVFEQWTLADLSDVGAPSLPPSCANCTKMMLTGKYAVQINYFLNIAVPFHKQLQKIRRPSAQKNLEVDNERQERERDRFKEDTSTRALKMEITDGVTTVVGFEDQPIPAIKNPIPGEKAVLSGPIEVRKGVLMLKAENVTMLGGEVDVLLVKNHTENLLARALKQPENPDPYGLPPEAQLAVPPQTAANLNAPPAPVPVPPSTPPARMPVPQCTPPAPRPNTIHDAFDDGEDEALASLAEAMENDSFQLEESPVSNRATNNNSNVRPNNPIPQTRPQAVPVKNSIPSKNLSKPSKTVSSLKQPSITAFLSQPKRANASPAQICDISSEIDDGFDDDFELIAAQTASLAEQRASASKNNLQDNHNPEKLKKQLEETYAVGATKGTASTSRPDPVTASFGVGTDTAACQNLGVANSSNTVGKPVDSRQQNKRKEAALEYDIFGRPKIPRNESNTSSSTSSEAPPFKNPRHVLPRDELMDSEELYDWLPPPPKANLEHVRPSHEKGKILIDYTDSSTLDLELVSTQKKSNENLRPELTKPAIPSTFDEPFPPKEFPCTRTTLGKVIKVVSKLQLRDAKWVLSAIVEAKGIELEMDFSPEALDKIFTVTAEEITRQKEQFKKNPELKEKFNGHLRESQKRIQALNCEMTIHFKNFISKPVVLDVSKND